MFETRTQLINKIEALFQELMQYEVELEDKKEQYIESINNLYRLTAEGFEECSRRLNRLEETACSIICHIKEPIEYLKDISEQIYEEKAAAEGERNEWTI